MQALIIVVGLGLIIGGLYFAIGGFGQEGSASGGGHGVTITGPPWLLLVAIGVGVVLFGAVYDFDEAPAGGPTTVAAGDGDAGTRDTGGTASTNQPAPTASDPTGECLVTVENPLASIREEPDTFSQEIVTVVPGTYPVEEAVQVDAPGGARRWLRITVDGRSGWLQDSTFNIAGKSPACP